jgi:DNA-directed RNA polymerase specialized sigma24 family protein
VKPEQDRLAELRTQLADAKRMLAAAEEVARAARAQVTEAERLVAAEERRAADRFDQQVMAKRELGMKPADIARAMGCSVPTVYRAIARWRHFEGLPKKAPTKSE